MNTKLIHWSAQLNAALFADGWSKGIVRACPNGTVTIDVDNRPTAIVSQEGVKKLNAGVWYNLETEDFYLCKRFREFIDVNPFPAI